MKRKVAVIGAGVGGLSAAIWLAGRGFKVRVYERDASPGGKAGIAVLDGVEVDTGPSLLTLPSVFEELYQVGGRSMQDELRLLKPEPAFRYLYPDGAVLDVHHRLVDTLNSVERTLGSRAAAQLHRFMERARVIWEEAAPRFVMRQAPTLMTMFKMGLSEPTSVSRVDPMRSMWRAICAEVEDEHLRWLLARYATYNGSNPWVAPATLNCIAHVELAMGGFGVEGGIHALVRGLVDVAERLGVRMELGRAVERIEVKAGRAVGVVTDRGFEAADFVVANADVAHVERHLLGRRYRAPEQSMSGWCAILKAKRVASRAAHTVVFPQRYEREFQDIFRDGRAPLDPAVYVCAQEACHHRTGWQEHEPLFVMINAPATRAEAPENFSRVEAKVMERLRETGRIDPGDRVLWRRTPHQLAQRFVGSEGALYGPSSNGRLAAFSRAANRVRGVDGLYLASGSAHPGGGLPLVALSGRAAAHALFEDAGIQVGRAA